jgi:hypothetical protein
MKEGKPRRRRARQNGSRRDATKEGAPERQQARRDEGGCARTAGGETRRRRARQNGSEQDGEALRPATARRLRPDRRRREGRSAEKPPCPPKAGLSAPDAFSSSGEPANLTKSSPFMPARRRIRRRTGASARVLVRQACESAHPGLNGLGVCKRVEATGKAVCRRRSGSSDGERVPGSSGEQLRRDATPLRFERRARAVGEPSRPRMCALAKGCARSPKDVRVRQRMCAFAKGCAGEPKDARASQRMRGRAKGCAGEPKDARASQRMRALAKGCARSPKDARAHHRGSARRRRACRRAVWRTGSPSDRCAQTIGGADTASGVRARPRTRSRNVGGARSPSAQPCKPSAERTRTSGVQLRRRACSFAVGREGALSSVPARASFPPAPRRAWRLGGGARRPARGHPGSRLGERTRFCATGLDFVRPGSKRDERA